MNAKDWRCAEEFLGRWEIRYPGTDGLINEGYVESLEFRPDGTFSWNPTPLWAKPEGRWGITGKNGTQQIKLYIEERKRQTFRGHWVVLNTVRFKKREERMIHWQRSRFDSVVFEDRILTGRRVCEVEENAPPERDATYPYLVVRIFAAIYQRERIQFSVGEPAVDVVNRRCFVRHPAPFAPDGSVSPDCRTLMIRGVQDAVRRLPFRMCIVWSAASCTYVETDSVTDHGVLPSGGALPLELDFKPQHYKQVEPLA